MLTNWLQRAAKFSPGAEPSVEDLIPIAAMARRCGVVVDPLSFMVLSDEEREALALADAAIQLEARGETWADETRDALRRYLNAQRD